MFYAYRTLFYLFLSADKINKRKEVGREKARQAKKTIQVYRLVIVRTASVECRPGSSIHGIF